jgi:hypothetical protein
MFNKVKCKWWDNHVKVAQVQVIGVSEFSTEYIYLWGIKESEKIGERERREWEVKERRVGGKREEKVGRKRGR